MSISYFLSLFLCISSLYADWNQEFDRESRFLLEQVPELTGAGYKEEYESFYRIRNALLQDGSLKRQIRESPLNQKLVLLRPREGIVIKKRDTDRIHELFAWELSLLFGYPCCLLPSFPIEIYGKKVIVQKMEPFSFGKGEKEMPSSSMIKKVPLENYWKAHLMAYLLGIGDLLGRNIGISLEGKIRFFDAEASFRHNNHPSRGDGYVNLGFMAESFDWPQYRAVLDRKTADSLRCFVRNMDGIEEKIRLYEQCRGLSLLNNEVLESLEKVRSFSFQEGVSFRDFLGFIYPKMSPGLDELNQIVSRIYKRKVDHGASLIFIFRHMPRFSLSAFERQTIEEWVSHYVD